MSDWGRSGPRGGDPAVERTMRERQDEIRDRAEQLSHIHPPERWWRRWSRKSRRDRSPES